MRDETLKPKILLSAIQEFAEKGYLGASLERAAKRCGTSSALACYYFGTKEGLAQAVIDHLAGAVKPPKAVDPALLLTPEMYRAALKKFISDFVDTFVTSEEPVCYIASLYRHEAAEITAKSSSLHDAVLWPTFLELEKLIAVGVPGGDPIKTRFWALAAWNILLGYTLKDKSRVGKYLPEGIPNELLRQLIIDFIVDEVLARLDFQGQ